MVDACTMLGCEGWVTAGIYVRSVPDSEHTLKLGEWSSHEPKATAVALAETFGDRCDDCFVARVIMIGVERGQSRNVGCMSRLILDGQPKDPPQKVFLTCHLTA